MADRGLAVHAGPRCADAARPPARRCVTGDAGRGLGSGDPTERLLAGADLCRQGHDPGGGHEAGHVATLAGCDQGDDAAGLPGASGTPAAMEVVLVVRRRVDVDDEVEVVDVDAACRDVRRDEDGDMPGLELREGAGAMRLGLAAVQGGGPDPAVQQVVGELVHRVLGVQEHDHPALPRSDLRRRPVLVAAVDVQDVVLHRRDGPRGRVDGVADRVGEVAADQEVDVTVECRGEQHALALGADLVQQRGDLQHEAHVGHLVGLVQHGDRDLVQGAVAALDEVRAAAPGWRPPTTTPTRTLSQRTGAKGGRYGSRSVSMDGSRTRTGARGGGRT
ncbi:hypothetical protein SBADM41S_08996 [Streptomyces badius]